MLARTDSRARAFVLLLLLSLIATVIGAFSPGPMKTSATNRSFHTQRNWKIANDASAGTDIGSTSR